MCWSTVVLNTGWFTVMHICLIRFDVSGSEQSFPRLPSAGSQSGSEVKLPFQYPANNQLPASEFFILLFLTAHLSLQRFDAVGLATERASGLLKLCAKIP